mgnify:CR=1 FL=1
MIEIPSDLIGLSSHISGELFRTHSRRMGDQPPVKVNYVMRVVVIRCRCFHIHFGYLGCEVMLLSIIYKIELINQEVNNDKDKLKYELIEENSLSFTSFRVLILC